MDRIDEIVAAGIELTRLVLERTPAHGQHAVDSLLRLRNLLALGLPDHPAIARIDEYLASVSLDARPTSLH